MWTEKSDKWSFTFQELLIVIRCCKPIFIFITLNHALLRVSYFLKICMSSNTLFQNLYETLLSAIIFRLLKVTALHLFQSFYGNQFSYLEDILQIFLSNYFSTELNFLHFTICREAKTFGTISSALRVQTKLKIYHDWWSRNILWTGTRWIR